MNSDVSFRIKVEQYANQCVEAYCPGKLGRLSSTIGEYVASCPARLRATPEAMLMVALLIRTINKVQCSRTDIHAVQNIANNVINNADASRASQNPDIIIHEAELMNRIELYYHRALRTTNPQSQELASALRHELRSISLGGERVQQAGPQEPARSQPQRDEAQQGQNTQSQDNANDEPRRSKRYKIG